MATALTLRIANDAAGPILELWNKASAFEATPSMAATNYAPHITLAVYDQIAPADVRRAHETIFSSQPTIALSLIRLRHFASPEFVIWAEPAPSERLLAIHAALHRLIDPVLCRPHYRPGAWVPHCTLAMAIDEDKRDAALDFVDQPITPIDAHFDTADCIAFPPIRVVESHALALKA